MSDAYKRFQAARGQAPAQPAAAPAPAAIRRPVPAPAARGPARAPARPRGTFGGGQMPAGDRAQKLNVGFASLVEYVSAYTSTDSGKPWAFVIARVIETEDPNIKPGEERLILHQSLNDVRVAEPICVRFAMSFLGMGLDQGADYDAYCNHGALTNLFIGELGDGEALDADGQPFPSFVGSRAWVEAYDGGEIVDKKPGSPTFGQVLGRYTNTRAFPVEAGGESGQ
jgi:hypothetical protein